MAQRLLVFHPNDILRLWTHYTDGLVPLTAEVKEVGVSETLGRMIIFFVDSPEWGDIPSDAPSGIANPLWIGYEGKRVLALNEKGEDARYLDTPEGPRRQ